MRDNRDLVTFIEQAIDREPFCTACGAPTDVRDHDGSLWLECSALDAAVGRVGRLVAALVGHDRKLLLVADERAA